MVLARCHQKTKVGDEGRMTVVSKAWDAANNTK